MDDSVLVLTLAAAVSAGTPLVFASVGEKLAERAGVLNLGVEGMMLIGAVVTFLAGDAWGNWWLALLLGVLAGGALAAVHAFLAVTLRGNQIVAGLALVTFAIGLSTFVGQPVEGKPLRVDVQGLQLPLLSDIPVVGRILFEQDPLVYASWVVVAVAAFYLARTRPGLSVRAVGEAPGSADAAGIDVARLRWAHVLAGGLLAGGAGAYIVLVRVPSWSQSATTGGLGWIALALVVFASWKPWRVLVGAYVFGIALRANFALQAEGIDAVPAEFLAMLPYVLTILVLIVLASGDLRRRAGAPAALGAPFVRDER
jgi:general nucleoside transport system permease protein